MKGISRQQIGRIRGAIESVNKTKDDIRQFEQQKERNKPTELLCAVNEDNSIENKE